MVFLADGARVRGLCDPDSNGLRFQPGGSYGYSGWPLPFRKLAGRFAGSGSAFIATGWALSSADILTAVVMDLNGHEIARVGVANGSFTLRGLPESLFVTFLDRDGNTVGRALRFDGVRPNQEIDVVLDIDNGNVVN